MQMRRIGILTLPCAGLRGCSVRVLAAWQQVLRAKAASLLAASRQQVVMRVPFKLQPRANALAVNIFSPVHKHG